MPNPRNRITILDVLPHGKNKSVYLETYFDSMVLISNIKSATHLIAVFNSYPHAGPRFAPNMSLVTVKRSSVASSTIGEIKWWIWSSTGNELNMPKPKNWLPFQNHNRKFRCNSPAHCMLRSQAKLIFWSICLCYSSATLMRQMPHWWMPVEFLWRREDFIWCIKIWRNVTSQIANSSTSSNASAAWTRLGFGPNQPKNNIPPLEGVRIIQYMGTLVSRRSRSTCDLPASSFRTATTSVYCCLNKYRCHYSLVSSGQLRSGNNWTDKHPRGTIMNRKPQWMVKWT